jgi:hypothetical protein
VHAKTTTSYDMVENALRTKLANLRGIFDQILKNDLFDAQSF